LIGYEGNKLVLQADGTDGLDGLVKNLAEDQVQYAYLRVVAGDNESKRSKFVFISWVGEKVTALKRAKVSVHKADVKKTLRDFAVEIHGEHHSELTEDIIMTKVRKAGGADYSGSLGK